MKRSTNGSVHIINDASIFLIFFKLGIYVIYNIKIWIFLNYAEQYIIFWFIKYYWMYEVYFLIKIIWKNENYFLKIL